MKGPRTGSRQRQHSTAVRITVIVYATMTTEQNHRLTQKRLVIRMKSPPVATSPTSTSSFPWKLGRLCSLRASCARIPDACGTFSDVAVLATFIACVVLDARGEAAAFWACHLTHAISASITLPTNCVGGSSTVFNTVRIRGTCRCITTGRSTTTLSMY